MPARAAAPGDDNRTDRPSIEMLPDAGVNKPKIVSSSSDRPDPTRPNNPTISPDATPSDTS